MKKKSLAHLGLILAAAVLCTGCGSNKDINPISELVLQGVSPPSANIGVNPPLDTLTYCIFRLKLSDNSMSMVPADGWTIDQYSVAYSLVSDTGHHLTALPADYSKNVKTKVSPGAPVKFPVQMVTSTYLRDNAQGFIGTADTATVKVHISFRVHRNKDGYAQAMAAKYIMNIGNF